MPPSGRRGKSRVQRAPAGDTHEASDVEAPEAITTPSRASKKRARGSDAPAQPTRNVKRKTKDSRALDREDTEGTEAHENSDSDTQPALPTELEIIASLRVSDKQVNATEDFANDLLEGQENVPGYGKIAGRDWVFIIRKIEVNIGRPEAHERLSMLTPGGSTNQPTTPTARTVIDIDLGPDRQVSRLHVGIHYDPDLSKWFLIVNGRNGIRLDNNLLKRGAKSYLRNGSVLEIANTQMAFITTAVDDNDGPIWDGSIMKQAQKSSEDDDEGDDDMRSASRRAHAHAPVRGTLQATSMYQSEYANQQQQRQQQQQQLRTHPHSQRAALGTPGTPMRNQSAYPKSSPAANYSRGMMIESTESIDYSSDGAKDLKPPHSYAQLIGMAILSTPESQMTLSNIYKWIMANYAFYRCNTGGWQNSIRHNLSLNKAFTKIARRTDEPGKGMKWMIEPSEFDNFVQQGMKGCRRPNPIPGTQSTLGSPNSPMRRIRAGNERDEEATPPLPSYTPNFPTTMEAYTPDRGSRCAVGGRMNGNVGLGINDETIEYDYSTRSTPRNGLTAAANAAGSPPALYVNDEGRIGPLDTPFPLRPSQRLAPPSTLRRPSDFIQFSSPAPFWKMQGLVGSTPFKPFDLSPLKTPFPSLKKGDPKAKDDEEEDDEVADGQSKEGEAAKDGESKSEGSPIINSSSPPRPRSSSVLDAVSPTFSRPATAVPKSLSEAAAALKEKTPAIANGARSAPPVQQQTPPLTAASASSQTAPPAAQPQPGPAQRSFEAPRPATNGHSAAQPSYNGPYAPPPVNGQTNGFHDDGDDEGIDLAKGFQPIGAFHQRNHLGMTMGLAGTPGYGR